MILLKHPKTGVPKTIIHYLYQYQLNEGCDTYRSLIINSIQELCINKHLKETYHIGGIHQMYITSTNLNAHQNHQS